MGLAYTVPAGRGVWAGGNVPATLVAGDANISGNAAAEGAGARTAGENRSSAA